MIYCDTSLLIANLTRESASSSAQHWLTAQGESSLCISRWVVTEFSSAIALKARMGVIDASMRAEALGGWRALLAKSLTLIQIPEDAFDLAARFCDRHESALRSGDALHLAIASLGGHSLATLDRAMAEAALAVGVAVEAV